MKKLFQTLPLLLLYFYTAMVSATLSKSHIILNNSSQMVIEIEGSYQFGDSDSIITARNALSEQLKADASDIFGVNIKSDIEIKNGKMTRNIITSYSNSFLTYTTLDENLFIKDTHQTLTTKAKITIDKKHFFNNLKKLKDSKYIEELARKNAELIEKLKKLNQQITANPANPKIYEGRKDILKQLANNQKRFKKSINISDLKKQLLMGQGELFQHRENIRIGVLKYIVDNSEIEISDPILKSSEGNNVTLSFHLNFKVPPKQIKSKLNKYYDKYSIRGIKLGEDLNNPQEISYWGSACTIICKSDNSKAIEFNHISKKIKALSYFDGIKKELSVYPELVFKLDGTNKIKRFPLFETNYISYFYLYSSSFDLNFTLNKDEIDFIDGLSFEFRLVRNENNRHKKSSTSINMEEYFNF